MNDIRNNLKTIVELAKNDQYYFMFSYNVEVKGETTENKELLARRVRNNIASHIPIANHFPNGWNTAVNVDTTISGVMVLKSINKINEAESIVRQELLKNINSCKAKNSVVIYVVLMVGCLGSSVEFTVN